MFQGANTDPLVPKAHISAGQNILFPVQINQLNLNVSWS